MMGVSGRRFLDPVVFFKLQLMMFFEGIRSEHQLMRLAADRLSLRLYLGYDLHETSPDNSSGTCVSKGEATKPETLKPGPPASTTPLPMIGARWNRLPR